MFTHRGCLEMSRFGAMGDHQPGKKSLANLSELPTTFENTKTIDFEWIQGNQSEKNSQNPAETVAVAHPLCAPAACVLGKWQLQMV